MLQFIGTLNQARKITRLTSVFRPIEMDRDQIHKDRDVIIDSYIRNELSDRDSDIFEEHLLFCTDCQEALIQRRRIVGSVQNLAAKESLQVREKNQNWSGKRLMIVRYVAAAAGVALVVGLFLLLNRDHASNSSQDMAKDAVLDTMMVPEPKKEEMAALADKGEGDVQKEQSNKATYIAAYQANPVYENQIGIHYRSGNLKVETPPDSLECLTGSSIAIRYRGAESDSLFFLLLNRRGEILVEKKIGSPYKLMMQYPEGLYYWQLTDDEESLHTAKIFVRPVQ